MARHSLAKNRERPGTEYTLPLQDIQKTILVVDDDAIVLKFVTSVLVRDHNVLSASSAKEAFQVSQDYQPAIHLLLADFEMPEMNGIALATQISLERPRIKVLLMSGFTGGMLVLNEGWHFLPKPFIASQLHGLIATLLNPEDSGKAKRHDANVIKTTLPHSAFGNRECRGCLIAFIRAQGADIACDECGAVLRTVTIPEIEWALAQMQFTFDASGSALKHR